MSKRAGPEPDGKGEVPAGGRDGPILPRMRRSSQLKKFMLSLKVGDQPNSFAGGGHTQLLSFSDELCVLIVRSNPDPNQSVRLFGGKGPIIQTNARRPKVPGLFEV